MNATYFITLLVGALIYWLPRYQRDFSGPGKLTFGEYLRYEWPAFIYCYLGGMILCGIYIYAGESILLILGRIWSKLEGLTLPAFNVILACAFGFAGKAFIDRLPRVVNYFGAKIKLPGAK